MTSYTRSLLQSGIRSQRIQFVSKLEMMHKYLQSAAKAQLPEYTIVQSPRDTVAQSPRDTVAQSPRVTIAQSPRVTIAQSPRVTIAQSPRDTKSDTPRPSSWAIFCCLPTSRLLLVRVGGPNVTAACPYPALRLDKLYAALIRCLVLWTVTKQFLVFRVLKDCIF